jgi:tetratricopeptide (TPR) repeat protein
MTEFTPLEAPAKDISGLPLMHPGRPVGRDDLLKDIFSHLQNRRPVLLHGPTGIGKTAVAAALAAAFFQQGVIWLNEGTSPLAALIVRIARGLKVTEVSRSEQPPSRIGALATALVQAKPLIVLDNVSDAGSVQQFITKAAENMPLLILSDTELEGSWQSIAVPALGDMDAVVLFKQKSGITTADHEIDIYGITKFLAYQPLPLVLAARGMVASKQNPGDYLKNLKLVQQSSNDALSSAIALSYRSLNSALQGLILMLGASFRGEASADFLSLASGVAEDGINQAMTILAQLFLVERFERAGKAYYRLPKKVHEFATAALEGKNQLAALQKKIHDTALVYAKQNSTKPQNLAKEMDSFIAAAQWAADNGDKSTANQLVTILTEANNFVQDGGYVYELLSLRAIGSASTQAFPAYPEAKPVVEEAPKNLLDELGLDEEDDKFDFLNDTDEEEEDEDDFDFEDEDEDEDELYEDELELSEEVEESFTTPDLGDLNIEEGMDSAYLRSDALSGIDIDQLRLALSQAKQQSDRPRILQILKAIGKVQVGQGKETEAITTYNEILEAYEVETNEEGTLDALNMLSALLTKTGNSQAAVMHTTRGIQLAQKLKDPTIELQLYTTLGDARQDLGETQAAVDSFKKALEIARKEGDRQNEAIALYKLGFAHLDNGDSEDAVHSLEQARSLFKEQNRRAFEGRVLGGLGSANSDLERWGEAIGYYQSALHISREVADKEEERLQLSNLAQAQKQGNRMGEALQSYRQALHLAYESKDRREINAAIVDLVRLLMMSAVHLDICDLLLRDAISRDPDDKDVLALVQQVNVRRQEALLNGKEQKPAHGTAQQYAENAYRLLEQ